MATAYENLSVNLQRHKDHVNQMITGMVNGMRSDVAAPGAIVRHFKGKLYKVLCTAVHTETAEEVVVYQALYPPFVTYARSKEMFLSKVDEEKYPEHAGEWRLRLATPEEIRGCEKNASSPMP